MSLKNIFKNYFPRIFFFLFVSALFAGCIGNTSWDADQWIEHGNRLAKDGMYSDAVEAYNQSLKIDAMNSKVLTYRGVALQHLGDNVAAMRDFDQALSINPNESAAWQGRSASYIDLGQYHQAIKSADKAIDLSRADDEKKENAYLLKGFSLNRLEQYEDALLAFDNAIAIDPKRLDLWQNKAYSLTKLGRFMEVLKCYEVMTGIDPRNAEIWSKKGEIHLALGQINEANEAFSIAKNLIKQS
jgi:tetratricopeptide (TPR) repeat protein